MTFPEFIVRILFLIIGTFLLIYLKNMLLWRRMQQRLLKDYRAGKISPASFIMQTLFIPSQRLLVRGNKLNTPSFLSIALVTVVLVIVVIILATT